MMEFSKRLISDIRALLWVVTVGGLLLAALNECETVAGQLFCNLMATCCCCEGSRV